MNSKTFGCVLLIASVVRYAIINNYLFAYSLVVSQSPYSITDEIGRRSIVYINRYEIKSLAIDTERFIDQQVANVDSRARNPKIKSIQSTQHANVPRGGGEGRCVN